MPHHELIYSYTRREAIADGEQIDVTEIAREAGIRYPVFLTRAVFDQFVTIPDAVIGQDESGRLWDVVWMLRLAMKSAPPGENRIQFELYVRHDNRAPRRRMLIALCGALDMDDPHPAITVMLPDED